MQMRVSFVVFVMLMFPENVVVGRAVRTVLVGTETVARHASRAAPVGNAPLLCDRHDRPARLDNGQMKV